MKLFRFLASFAWLMTAIPAMAADHFPVASNSVTLIVGKDGQVYASGDARPNRGDASQMVRNYFEPIAGLKDIVSVDVECQASDGAVALDKNGDVWMWGRNWCDVARGEQTTDRHVPVKHPALSGIRSVVLGDRHLVALHKDGRVLTVGSEPDANAMGLLGNGTLETLKPTAPNFGVVEVAGITDAVAVAATDDSSFILRSDGTVWAMGSRMMFGKPMSKMAMFTDPDFEAKLPVPIPTRIRGLSGITAISAGREFAIALDRKGQVWGWGINDSGQLGTDISDLELIALKKLKGLKDIVSISAGNDFMLAADSSGKVYARGGNTYGVLGNDGEGDDGKLYRVPKVASTQVIAGYYTAFAVREDGSIVGWGCNNPSVGGFCVDAVPANIPPTAIDIKAKPAPPSAAMLAGGVKLRLGFELYDYEFESESAQIEIDGKGVYKFDVNTDSAEQESFLELPVGVHEYQIKGQATSGTGQQHEIIGSGVILVSKQTLREKFDSMVAERGLMKGTEQFIDEMNLLSDRISLTPLVFTNSEAWSDDQLDSSEKKLGLKLPESYRNLMKTIGPFQLGHPKSPHPSVSLLPVDAERNLESFVQQILQENADAIPSKDYRNIVEEAASMKGELSTNEVLEARKTWNQNLIVGTAEDKLYLLIGEMTRGERETYSVLWASLFEELEDDDGVQLDYFQWTEFCEYKANWSTNKEKPSQRLADGIYSVLARHFESQGFAPLVRDAEGKVSVASIVLSMNSEEDLKPGEKVNYRVWGDDW